MSNFNFYALADQISVPAIIADLPPELHEAATAFAESYIETALLTLNHGKPFFNPYAGTENIESTLWYYPPGYSELEAAKSEQHPLREEPLERTWKDVLANIEHLGTESENILSDAEVAQEMKKTILSQQANNEVEPANTIAERLNIAIAQAAEAAGQTLIIGNDDMDPETGPDKPLPR